MTKKRPLSEILDGLPPSDRHAEMALIGSLMLDPARRLEVAGIVAAEDFYHPPCGILFAAILKLATVDAVLLIDALKLAGTLDAAGGRPYVAECIASAPVAAHAAYYAGIVAEQARKRRMVELNRQVLVALYSGRWTAKELAQRHIERLKEIVDG